MAWTCDGLLCWGLGRGRAAAAPSRIGRAGSERKYRLASDSIAACYPGSQLDSRLGLDARRYGGDHARRHLELGLPVLDAMPSGDPIEVRVDGPDLSLFVLDDEKSHRPIEPGIRIRGLSGLCALPFSGRTLSLSATRAGR